MPRPPSPSRLATAVRAARHRRGWSRETLAHHCALSYAAITQIESGRRTEVRVSSLVAIAEALGVSVDYLVRGELATPMLNHRVYLYDSPPHLAEVAQQEVGGGLAAGRAVLVVATQQTAPVIRSALGSDARRVTFADSTDWYTTPAQATARYARFARDARKAGADWIDIFGEPVWTGRTRAEADAWLRYESLLNVVFAPWPVSVGCLYNRDSLSPRLLAGLARTHPEVATADHVITSPTYEAPEQFLAG